MRKFQLFIAATFLISRGLLGALPNDLMYEGKGIPDTFLCFYFGFPEVSQELDLTNCLKEEPPITYDNDCWGPPNIDFKWDYLGTFPGNFHLIKTYYWEAGAMGKFTSLLLVKREGQHFKISDALYGGDRHASMIFSANIKDNKITYSQGATSLGLMEIAAELFPDIKQLYEKSSKTGLCWGEACYIGKFEYEVTVTPGGKFKNMELLSFSPGEGEPGFLKGYTQKELRTFALELLIGIDRDKPEEFKEEGIAYSPVCFQKILEEDLRGESKVPKSISISSFKNTPSSLFSSFSWSYIGKIDNYHIIRASLTDYGSGSPFGIYTVVKEGNILKKIARILHCKDRESWEIFSTEVDDNTLTYFEEVSASALFSLLKEKYPEYDALIKTKDLAASQNDLKCGMAKIQIHLLKDGSLGRKELIGFMGSGDQLREKREVAIEEKDLKSFFKKALDLTAPSP